MRHRILRVRKVEPGRGSFKQVVLGVSDNDDIPAVRSRSAES
jgi:hypothetical protein